MRSAPGPHPTQHLLAYGAALVGAAIAAFVLTDANPVVQTPFHDDDFYLLATTLGSVALPLPRPVSTLTIAALATLGPTALYGALLALVVAYPLLCVLFVDRFLEIGLSRGGIAFAAFAAAFGTFLYEHAPETFRYTGHLTNALSTVLGMAAAVVMLGGTRSASRATAAAALFALSVYAKEDLAPFVCAVAAILFLEPPGVSATALTTIRRVNAVAAADVPGRRRAGVLLGVLVATAASALLYSRALAEAAFTSNRGVYGADFDPLHVIAAVARYLVCSPLAATVLGLALGVTVLVGVRRDARVGRLGLSWGLVVALVLPYAPLSNHVFDMYAYNWLPFILAILVVGALAVLRSAGTMPARALISRRAATAVAITTAFVAAAGLVAVSQHDRDAVARTITVQQTRVRAVTDALARHRDALAGFDQVAVEGLDDMRTPWLFSDGRYVERLMGRPLFWLFVARPDSFVARLHREFDRPIHSGAIFVVPPTCGWLRDAPRLRFSRDLQAELVPPDPTPVTPSQGRIDLGSPDAARVFCGGWSEPAPRNGGSLRWVEGPIGMLALPFDREREARLSLGLVPAPAHPARTLHVFVDGTRVATVPVPPDPTSVAVTVSPRVIRYPVSHVFLWFADWTASADGLQRTAALASIAVE